MSFSDLDLKMARDIVINRNNSGAYLDRIDEVLPLVAKGLSNGDAMIGDNFEQYGCMGVVCKVGHDAFYFGGNSCFCDTLEEYRSGRDGVDILADVAEGILSLLFDDDGLNSDEGEYVVSVLREAI